MRCKKQEGDQHYQRAQKSEFLTHQFEYRHVDKIEIDRINK